MKSINCKYTKPLDKIRLAKKANTDEWAEAPNLAALE